MRLPAIKTFASFSKEKWNEEINIHFFKILHFVGNRASVWKSIFISFIFLNKKRRFRCFLLPWIPGPTTEYRGKYVGPATRRSRLEKRRDEARPSRSSLVSSPRRSRFFWSRTKRSHLKIAKKCDFELCQKSSYVLFLESRLVSWLPSRYRP